MTGEVYNELLDQVRRAEAAQEWRRELEDERSRAEAARRIQWKKDFLLPYLRKATLSDWLGWLRGYMALGCLPTHVYNYPFARANMWVALEDIEMRPLYGSEALKIIVPAGLKAPGDPGHCRLYLMDDFRASIDMVPIYSDVEF